MFAIAKDAGRFCIEAFFFRAFQNWGNRAYFPRADQSLSEEEVLAAFLAQFYGEHPAAPLVLLSHKIEDREVLEDALYVRAKRDRGADAPARREARTRRARPDQRAADAGAKAGGGRQPGEAARGARRVVWPGRRAPPG